MFRELDLIDVWFDSGAMPYAQWYYPFENKELIDSEIYFPADYIAGVDQTRGWFILHAIATLVFNKKAFKMLFQMVLYLTRRDKKCQRD